MSDYTTSDVSNLTSEDIVGLIAAYSTDGTEAGLDIAAIQAAINSGSLATGINEEDALAYVAASTLDLSWLNPDVSLTDASWATLDEMRRETAPYESLAEFHDELTTYLGLQDANTTLDDAAILIEEAGVDNQDDATTGTAGDADAVVITNIVQLLMMATGGNVALALMGMAMGWDPEYTVTEEDVAAGEITLADGSTIDIAAEGYQAGGTITFENDSVLEDLSNAALAITEDVGERSAAKQELVEDYPDVESETFAEEAKVIDVGLQDHDTAISIDFDIIETLQKFKEELTQMISQTLNSQSQTTKGIIANM
jgi:hypothetical protein